MKNNFDYRFFQIHPEYKPFVGSEYEKYKILIVGESHYIGQEYNVEAKDKYDVKYFLDNWLESPCDELIKDYGDWFNTVKVIEDYMNGNRTKGHLIFTNIIKSFSEIVLEEKIQSISNESCKKFSCLAFMNFFQMPSIYKGEKYWSSLIKSSKKLGYVQLAYDLWQKVVDESVLTLDYVIEQLKPKKIFIFSQSAYCAYKENRNSKYKDKIISLDHAGSPWWYRKKKDGEKASKEMFEDYLKEYKNEIKLCAHN